MDLRTKLDVIHIGPTTDYSKQAQDFARDNFAVTMLSNDFMYIGYKKDINAIYIAMETPNVNPATLSFEYNTSSGWTPLVVSDDTCGLIRNGFVTWERPSDAVGTTVNSKEQCWVRFSSDVDTSAMDIQAISIIFADDHLIQQEVPALIDPCFYADGQSNFLLQHVATKNYIMSRLKSLGYIKSSNGSDENINEWDLLDIYEIRQAAVYHAISQIYFNLSDSPDDQYWVKYQEYFKKFEEALALGQLRIDTNDDGQVQQDEKRPIKTIRWER